MAEVSTDPTPPPIPDPVLENLNVEQLAQLVNEINPEVFYQRAQAFDTAAARLQDVRDVFRREARQLQEAWTGKIAESFENVAQETSGTITNILQPMQDPGYGARLRQAGDALAMSQQRLKDLQAQKTQQAALPPVTGAPPAEVVEKGNQQSALQIVHDLCTAYRDIGTGITPLPETAPASTGNAAAGAGSGTGGSGSAPITVAHYSVTPASGEGTNAGPLAGSSSVNVLSRGQSDVSYSGASEGSRSSLPFSDGALGGLDGTSNGSGSGGGAGGTGGYSGVWSRHSDAEPSFLMSPGGAVHGGGSVVGRAKSVDADSAEATAFPPGSFEGCAAADGPVLGQRRSGSAVPDSVTGDPVEGIVSRRQLVSEPVDGVLGRGQTMGLPPVSQRSVVAKAPKTEKKPVTVSEGEQGSVESGKKDGRPVTVAEPVVVARSEVEPAAPVTEARTAVAGLPPLSTALPVVVDTSVLTAAAGAAAPLVSADRGPLVSDAGMPAGGSAAQAVLPVRALSAEGASALPGGASPVITGAPQSAAGSAPMEGGPMSPMMGMGGVGGQQDEDTERESKIVPGPDPDVWDNAHGASSVLGKPEQITAEPVVQESPDDVMARILERRS